MTDLNRIKNWKRELAPGMVCRKERLSSEIRIKVDQNLIAGGIIGLKRRGKMTEFLKAPDL